MAGSEIFLKAPQAIFVGVGIEVWLFRVWLAIRFGLSGDSGNDLALDGTFSVTVWNALLRACRVADQAALQNTFGQIMKSQLDR